MRRFKRIFSRVFFHTCRFILKIIELVSARIYMKLYVRLLKNMGLVLTGLPRYIAATVKFDDFERIEKAKLKSAALKIVIVLKGHHTLITTPDGRLFFNNTGNAGMAKGGSGDVLTGIITAFAAQKYSSVEAAILGVYIHGLAGDLAAGALSQEAMAATDIIHYLSKAFLKINNY